ncbi:hypothetical protein [Telluria aromaticivorans]|uniref:Uncharacterized protein n=1 Tax=Telluria aromaticivorans TaxID=2725995 RepID=A0A7Y2JXD3_9BURK|nr:hypothetical protein [Telluria aromaticivorans]NNG22747.1 hypothetical protein [Telluria aromaticivorans]
MEHPEADKRLNIEEFFGQARFDIEHALSMYALSYCTIPAEAIYDKDALAPFMSVIEKCHIYLIGYTPIIELTSVEQKESTLELKFEVLGKQYSISYPIPAGFSLKTDENRSYLQNSAGEKIWPKDDDIQQKVSAESKDILFEVKYVGQAYGQDGSRNAIDRLLKHETLQKISLKGVPKGYKITLLLLAVQPNNQIITSMNPFAKTQEDGAARIESGLTKLFNTTEAERISLYEAALIRYFYPEFNREFKDSFPSTNLKILQDCYKKDFCSIIAEICFDELPFQLWSNSIDPSLYHAAKFDIHKDEDRRMFFGL